MSTGRFIEWHVSQAVTWSAKCFDKICLTWLFLFFLLQGGNENNSFILSDPIEGVLVVNKPLDYDGGIREFKIQIQASDHGSPISLSSTTTMTIKVKDADDQNPVFSQDVYRASVSESATITVSIILFHFFLLSMYHTCRLLLLPLLLISTLQSQLSPHPIERVANWPQAWHVIEYFVSWRKQRADQKERRII